MDAGDEQILARAVLDLNAKVDALAAKVAAMEADPSIRWPLTLENSTIVIDVQPQEPTA